MSADKDLYCAVCVCVRPHRFVRDNVALRLYECHECGTGQTELKINPPTRTMQSAGRIPPRKPRHAA